MTTDTLLKSKKEVTASPNDWESGLVMEIKDAAKEVTRVTQVPWKMILGRRRYEDVAVARMILWCIMRNRGYGYSRIGRASGRDHACIMHANKVIPQRYGHREWAVMTSWIDELEEQPEFTVIVKGEK
tara:strand:- start:1588 stop:1971 length:384 start_codon:yes stop_codon:yes gene_type:complete